MDTTPTRRELLQSLGVAVAATAVGGHATGQPVDQTTWPTLGADNQNTGFSPDATGPETAPNPLWTVDIREPIEGSAAVSEGMVFMGGTNNTFYGFDAESGDETDEGWELETGGEIHSTPALADIAGDERVYVGSDDGVVYAFNRATGTELDSWSFSIDGQIRSSPTVVEALTDVGPLVLIGAGGAESGLYALDADTGEIEWEQGTDADVVGAPAVSISGEEPTVYCCTEDGRLLALDVTDGTSRWPPFEDGDEGGFSGSPVVSDDYVYVASRDSTLYAIDPETGESDWEFETGGVIVATPALGEEYLYLGSRDGSVYAITPATGAEAWEFETDQLIVAPPAIGGDTVFVGTSPGGDLLALDAATGEEQWAVAMRGDIRSQPVVAANRIYLGDGSGQFYALDPDADEDADGLNGETDDDDDDGFGLDQVGFLAWPASILAMLGIGGGIVYAASRAGIFSRIEEAADSVGPDREELLEAEESSEPVEADGQSAGESPPSAVWELVLDDVISRSEETDSTATDDLLVTKYVDRETLQSPVVAYEIESFRDEPATVRLSEPFVTEPADAESTPMGDNWTVTDKLTFEQQISPGETVRTIVGRRDCPTERAEELLDRPTIEVSDS